MMPNVDQGMKDDRKDNKIMFELVPPEIFEAIGDVMTYGADKYEADNWKLVDIDRYYAAALRHIFAWKNGEDIDSESGKHHLAHALTNLGFMYWMDIQNGTNSNI